MDLSESGRSALGLIAIHSPVCFVQLLIKLPNSEGCLEQKQPE